MLETRARLREKNVRRSNRSQIVMAAGSVTKEPNNGPTVKIVIHHAAGVPRAVPATTRSPLSARVMTGRVDASAMMTTTKSGSV